MFREMIVLGDLVLIPYLYGGEYKAIRRDNTAEQLFTFKEEGTGLQRHYDVSRLMSIALAGSEPEVVLQEMIFLDSHIRKLIKDGTIEPYRVKRLTPKDLATPGLMARMPDKTEIIADGNHRMVRLWTLHRRSMMFYVLTEEAAKPALLDLSDEEDPGDV
jgi:hypothetical protein